MFADDTNGIISSQKDFTVMEEIFEHYEKTADI